MGIRFACPNGHRLNVKSYLAGKRGICPDCGIRFDIPLASWPDFENGDKSPNTFTEVQTNNPAPPGGYTSPALPERTLSASAARQTHESTARDKTAHQPPTLQTPPTEMPVDLPPAEPSDAKLPTSLPTKPKAAATTDGADSLTGDQLWYVQTTDGNRYGPVDDQTMHEWIAEGRVAPDNLVHQRGWPTWKTAAAIFGELRQEDTNEVAPDLVVDTSPRALRSRGRQKAKPRLVALIATLGIASVVLLGVLIYVINRS